ncbi:hypothetical protein [Dictyobacter arantiisoli]|uniref:hypothetical protein n=1 Tax=Dictyobacter arantiisoli TaxID=2014874 RepID=UPI00155A468D|nr:hypothetical protein [Dictyobacter arantiisoli]
MPRRLGFPQRRETAFWYLFPIDLYDAHGNRLMRLLNPVDTAMANSGLVKTAALIRSQVKEKLHLLRG